MSEPVSTEETDKKPEIVEPAQVIIEQEPIVSEPVSTEETDKEPEIIEPEPVVVEQKSKPKNFVDATVAVKDRKSRKGFHIFRNAAKKIEENPRDIYRKMRKQKKKGMPVGYQTTSGNDM